ncbi:MAG: hypothetical protein SNJ74_05965 [Fimbriimonadaceae bacterium]
MTPVPFLRYVARCRLPTDHSALGSGGWGPLRPTEIQKDPAGPQATGATLR